MGGSDSEAATVLIVEDEDKVAELFTTILSARYHILRASNGGEALEKIDETVDVVLLDRRMPEMSGDRALEHIESRELDCRVAMVSGVDPDFDVIDMGFDDYLVKPVENAVLLDTVERLLALDEYEAIYQDLSSKLVKRNVIQVEKTPEELEENAEFQQLTREITKLQGELDQMQSQQEFDERLLPT